MSAIDHVRLEQLQVGDVSVAALKFAHVLDLLELMHDEGCLSIAFGVDEGENIVAFFPAILAGEPSGNP